MATCTACCTVASRSQHLNSWTGSFNPSSEYFETGILRKVLSCGLNQFLTVVKEVTLTFCMSGNREYVATYVHTYIHTNLIEYQISTGMHIGIRILEYIWNAGACPCKTRNDWNTNVHAYMLMCRRTFEMQGRAPAKWRKAGILATQNGCIFYHSEQGIKRY